MAQVQQKQPQQKQEQPLVDNGPATAATEGDLHDKIDDKKGPSSELGEAAAAAAAAAKYVSPSDSMMSPTSKKLSEIKGRRLGSSSASASLSARNMFARMREGREEKEKQQLAKDKKELGVAA